MIKTIIMLNNFHCGELFIIYIFFAKKLFIIFIKVDDENSVSRPSGYAMVLGEKHQVSTGHDILA